ncbi:unnamed protein product [Rhodiola kirilowii]
MAEVKKTKRSLTYDTPPFFHPLISLSSLGLLSNAPKQSSRNHTISSSPFLAHIFSISLISFFTVISIVSLIVTISISGHNHKESSLLVSLFLADSSSTSTLPSHPIDPKMSNEEAAFWKQKSVKGYNYKPCLDFSLAYRKRSVRVSKEKRRFLVVVVSGDLYQWRDQIVDAVVVARILGAAMVVPFLQNESGFEKSEFSDIFDVEHFKRILRTDVRVVASHPYAHLSSGQLKAFELPRCVTPLWILTKFSKQLNDDGVLLLTGIGSKLSRKLPPDLQKLRCKVAFEALRFANPVREIGYRLSKRIWIEGPYAAFDLGHNSVNSTHLKGLGVPRSATLYAAGAKLCDRAETLKPLFAEFPNLVTMETLDRAGELLPFVNCSSALAAIDYIIAFNSDVFLVSHESYLSRSLQGHRVYIGGNKVFVLDLGRQELRIDKREGRDGDAVGVYLAPECMCRRAFELF